MYIFSIQRLQINQRLYPASNPNCADNSEKNILTTSISLTTTCYARGLDINSPLSAETHAQDPWFHRHQQHGDQQRLGARQQLRLWTWLWFYDNNSPTSASSTTVAPTTPHPIKAKFSLPRVDYYLLSSHPALGGSAMKNHPAYHWLQKFEKARVAGDPRWILDNSDTVAEVQLTDWQGTETFGVRLTKRLSK
jgi:hypothetical protein